MLLHLHTQVDEPKISNVACKRIKRPKITILFLPFYSLTFVCLLCETDETHTRGQAARLKNWNFNKSTEPGRNCNFAGTAV